ncbi:MAG: class I SAM-dependent methyltransferase [Candidatus Dojkabacteria bacterium]|nr:class I SAM-dependent methyltransferase [Candidatus Dojkabacteria bacterium]
MKIIKKYKPPPSTLIDCGCNIGRWVEYFTKQNYDYTGVDQSEYAIKVAHQLHPNNKFINSLLWEIDFNNTFDIAFFNAVLQHNTHEEKRKILPKVYQALKKDGVLIFKESTVKEQTETQFTQEEWISLVESYGFEFKESWHKNELGLEDNYIFRKV